MNFLDYSNTLSKSNVPIMGYIAWYYVPNTATIEHATLKQLVTDTGAPMKLPSVPNSGDVFRRACSQSQRSRQNLPSVRGVNMTMNYKVVNTGSDAQIIHRTVMVEHVDSTGHKLDPQVVGSIEFDKTLLDIHAIGSDPHFLKLVEEVRDYVDVNLKTVSHGVLSHSFRQTLEGPLVAVRLKPSGGIYFVADGHADELSALHAVSVEIPDMFFHAHPCIDDQEQRAMVREAFEADSVVGIDALIGEMADVLKEKNGKITPKEFARYQSKFQGYRERISEYKEMLGGQLNRSDTSLELAGAQVLAMLEATSDDN